MKSFDKIIALILLFIGTGFIILVFSSVTNEKDDNQNTVIYQGSPNADASTAVSPSELTSDKEESKTNSDTPPQSVTLTEGTTTQATTTVYVPSYPIGINKAIYEDFIGVKGIGEVTAGKILAFREKRGVIHSLDELIEIDGIGDGTVSLLKEYFFVDPAMTVITTTTTSTKTTAITKKSTTTAVVTTTEPQTTTVSAPETTVPKATTTTAVTTTPTTTTQTRQRVLVDINKASAQEFVDCLFIDISDAEAIVEFRERIGYFTNIRELIYVIDDSVYLEIRDYIYVG